MKKLSTLLFLLLIAGFTHAQIPNYNITVNTGAMNGYFFFCPYKLSAFPSFPPGAQNQMVMDGNGHVVYYRPIDGYFAGDFKVQKNGLITHAGDGQYMIMDSTFTVIDSVTNPGGIDYDLHDLIILPNGHYLLLGNEDITMDLSSYHMFNNNGTAGSSSATVTCGVLQELDSAKNVVWEWHSKDYFAFPDVDEFFLTDVNNVDWTHMNSIEMDTDSNIIISSRHFAEITKINHADSTIMWRLGGKNNMFTFINDTVSGDTIPFLAQHDARRLPNGNLLLFDNGRANPLHRLSAKEYALDEVNMTATLVWSHQEGPTVFSRSQGNCNRLSNGNTLISYGNPINENIVFNVVDPSDNKVFEISFPDTQITYRTYFYDSINFENLRPLIACAGDSLMAEPGHTSYMWSTSDTTQNLFVNYNDTFYVYTPVVNGGMISSEAFIVTDSTNICSPLAVNEISKGKLMVYPNPANDRLFIKLNDALPVDIFDITGRHLMHFAPQHDQLSIDVSSLIKGVYVIRAGKYSLSFIKS
jgi:hypothetical protein